MSHFLIPKSTISKNQEQAVLSQSLFLSRWVNTHPKRWQQLKQAGVLEATDPSFEPPPEPDEMLIGQALREYRNEQLVILAWRDLVGIDDLETNLQYLTELAQKCIATALVYAKRSVERRHGRLLDAQDQPIDLIVIAMGKLGGGELNFSSDVDLIFSYAGHGHSDGTPCLDAKTWLTRVARRLVQLLGHVTEAGFVYRVDTRLRPFGDAGALVLSADAMVDYYQKHGREWERYAWIKARPVAGDIVAGHALIKRLQPFIYRRYLDYGAFESIREMKAMIDQQVERAELQNNIKLGIGGIREIEFVVQAFQLVRGGHEPWLQENSLLAALWRLEKSGYFTADIADILKQHYCFLRRLENRLQMWADQQTHDLVDRFEQLAALARSLNFSDGQRLKDYTAKIRQQVHDIYAQVFVTPQADIALNEQHRLQLIAFWKGKLATLQAVDLLSAYGLTQVEQISAAIADLRKQNLYGQKNRGQRWLMRLVPMLFAAAATTEYPDLALLRALKILDTMIGRSTYIAMLLEYPKALSTLMRLCAASPWITSQLSLQPALIDNFIDLDRLYQPIGYQQLSQALQQDLAAVDRHDFEAQIDQLRHFTHGQMLRIAAADVSNALPLMVVSDHLTALAEVVVKAALALAWQQMQVHYGWPRKANGEREDFCIVGYGKLGGIELGYGSDLDLVFLFDGAANTMTDGAKPLTHQVFFTRLAQRVVHILSLQTSAGRAYEVDLRLRPGGQAGLLVIPMQAFANYQRERAWTWEHQALVRARAVAGSGVLCQRFGQIRREVLAQPVPQAKLIEDVVSMRERMRKNLDQSNDEHLDLKQMPGGLVDIEFMAQLCALRFGANCPELLIFSDTIRILETMESAQLAGYSDIKKLTAAYRAYRRYIHKFALQEQRALIDYDELEDERLYVQKLWHDWTHQGLAADKAGQ